MEFVRFMAGLYKELMTLDEEYPAMLKDDIEDQFFEYLRGAMSNEKTLLDLMKETYEYGKEKYGVKISKINVLYWMALTLYIIRRESSKMEMAEAINSEYGNRKNINRFINDEKYDDRVFVAYIAIIKIYAEIQGASIRDDFVKEVTMDWKQTMKNLKKVVGSNKKV